MEINSSTPPTEVTALSESCSYSSYSVGTDIELDSAKCEAVKIIEVQDVNDVVKPRKNNAMKLFASLAGNVLEWYDFAVFGYFGDIIGDVFFPPQAGHLAIMESYAVFGGAFVARPLGGILMGYIGDTYGRKKALTTSMFLMAFPTFLMGCLPSYAQIGWPAIVLLILVRLLQGVSVGGQLMSSLVLTVESAPKNLSGFYGSTVLATANMGTLMGNVVAFLIRNSLSDEAMRAWGWRLPFLAGIVVAFFGIYLKGCEDDAPVHMPKTAVPKNPIRIALSPGNRRSLLSTCLVPCLWVSSFYIGFVWMVVFESSILSPPVPNAYATNSVSLLLTCVLFFPVAGYMSDLYGRVRIMVIAGFGLAIAGPVTIHLISLRDPIIAFFAQILFGILLCCWGSPMMAWLVESFEPEARLTSVAIGYNVACAIGAGLGPSIATMLVDSYGVSSPGYLITCFAVFALLGLWISPKKRNHVSDELLRYEHIVESDTSSETTTS